MQEHVRYKIAEAARIYPDRVAVSSAAGELTYRELMARAASLADHLLSLGVDPEERVAIAMGRRPELLLAMLAMEAAFGIPGVIAAPIFYAYIKRELIYLRLV